LPLVVGGRGIASTLVRKALTTAQQGLEGGACVFLRGELEKTHAECKGIRA